MARSDLILALVKAGASGDRTLAQTSAEALIADERRKQHHVMAERLTNALRANGTSSSLQSGGTTQRFASVRELVSELVPKRQLIELILQPVTRKACEAFVEEHQRADLLRAHGLEPRNRVLMSGPPGNGKTTLAEAIAEALSVPLVAVRYEGVIGSFLGETAGRLRRVFEFARTMPCVLFFDEFDVVGKERGDIHETGEIKRVVSSLLLQVDDLPSWTIVAAATNHSELLDRAAWRRFQLRLELPRPTTQQVATFVERFFLARQLAKEAQGLPQRIAAALRRASFAEVEDVCTSILRRYVLSMNESSLDELLKAELEEWRRRAVPNNSDFVKRTRARKTTSRRTTR